MPTESEYAGNRYRVTGSWSSPGRRNFEVAKKGKLSYFLEEDYHTRYEALIQFCGIIYHLFLMQNLYFKQSINMAALVQDQLREEPRKDRGVLHKVAGTGPDFDAGVLIETGFITIPMKRNT